MRGSSSPRSPDARRRAIFPRSIAAVSTHLPQADTAHARLARHHGVSILAGSAPERRADGSVRNVARLFTPDGACGRQEKIMMTRFEREHWGVSGGAELFVYDIGTARIGIAICYDVEFPLIARALAEAGAEVILAPSCTDTVHGYWRVRVGAQARALENQCVVVQAPLVGTVDWSPAVDVNRGAAGVFGPPDLGFPEDGVMAQGEMDKPCWVAGAARSRRDRARARRRPGLQSPALGRAGGHHERHAHRSCGADPRGGKRRVRPRAQAQSSFAPKSSAKVSATTPVALRKSSSTSFSSARWPLASSRLRGPAP